MKGVEQRRYLGDGEIHSNVDDDKKEEKVECANEEQWLLEQHELREHIVKLSNHQITKFRYKKIAHLNNNATSLTIRPRNTEAASISRDILKPYSNVEQIWVSLA